MSPRSKREYTEAIHKRYKHASRSEKKVILDEFCATSGHHRKYAIMLLKGFKRFRKPIRKKRGPKPLYRKDEIIKPLKRIWLAANLPCSKRLKAILPLWLPGYTSSSGCFPWMSFRPYGISPLLPLTDFSSQLARYAQHGRSTTKPGTLLRKQIPIAINQWDESRPGFLEADTVAHCGDTTAGMYVSTLDFVDIATGWTEQRAVWGKGERAVLEQIADMESSLPFPLLGFDCDNGSEFLNYHLFRHFTERTKPVSFTRSRAYHKDDNAHIEQKNWTHVRQWLSYERFDDPRIVVFLNDLYRNEWRLFHNFFCPSVKLISKERIGSDGGCQSLLPLSRPVPFSLSRSSPASHTR